MNICKTLTVTAITAVMMLTSSGSQALITGSITPFVESEPTWVSCKCDVKHKSTTEIMGTNGKQWSVSADRQWLKTYSDGTNGPCTDDTATTTVNNYLGDVPRADAWNDADFQFACGTHNVTCSKVTAFTLCPAPANPPIGGGDAHNTPE